MQRNQHSSEEEFMLFLERQCKTINDRSKNLEKFSDSIETLCFINELEEDVVYGAADVGTKVEEFAIDSVERCLEEIALSRIF